MELSRDELLKNDFKVYVDVNEDRLADGQIIPKIMTWEDGNKYSIDKILDIQKAVSLKAGGVGLRYTVKIEGKTKYMFLEENRWFLERK